MEESPSKKQSTSRVIDSLHSQIDQLKNDMEVLKMSCGDYKKKSTILASKNDSLVDQLANCKHENDMVNALLKRKERRITDLESEFDDVNSESESLKQSVKNYKIRCENLQNSSASSTAEFERLKISYDALTASQTEYKRHYSEELQKLTAQLNQYKSDSSRSMDDLKASLERNDKDVDALLEGLNSKRTSMDNVLVERNKSILALLAILAKVAKTHGEECRSILSDNVEIINTLREKIPEVFEKIPERSATTIDVDELLRDSAISLDTSLPELDAGRLTDSTRQSSRVASSQGRKKNRNSARLSPEASVPENVSDAFPKSRAGSRQQNGLQRQPSKRNSSHGHPQSQGSRNSSSGRQLSSGSQKTIQKGINNNNSNSISSSGHKQNSSNGQSKNQKRRSFHGGSNNYNIGNGEKGLHAKAEDDI